MILKEALFIPRKSQVTLEAPPDLQLSCLCVLLDQALEPHDSSEESRVRKACHDKIESLL